MRRVFWRRVSLASTWLAAWVLVLGTAVAVAARQSPNMTASDPDDATLLREGKAVTADLCSDCHDLDDVYISRKTQRQWDDTVSTMITKGAVGNTAQFALVKRYLTRTFGLLPINTAAAAEISAVLGLTAKDASAIVEYRQAHGDFADRAALSKVEGIDQKKIDEQPDALKFSK